MRVSGSGGITITVLNELDAAVNINLTKREINSVFRKLNIYRLGTSGSLQEDILVNDLVASHVVTALETGTWNPVLPTYIEHKDPFEYYFEVTKKGHWFSNPKLG